MATRSVSPIATKTGKVAGSIGVVVGGGVTACDTYQTDAEQYPEWSEGHKIARAGVKGIVTGGAMQARTWLGAKGGAAIDAAVSGPFAPVDAVISSVVDGIIGGVIGHHVGKSAGDRLDGKDADHVAASME